MHKRIFVILGLLIIVSMVMAACSPSGTPEATEAAPGGEETEAVEPEPAAGGEPEACAADEFGCAVIPPGDTIKIGMGAPMTGDNANFGTDISQGATIAVQDGAELNGFEFELVAEDDGGTPEGGAAVANRLSSDPTVVAIAGHIFSGATEAAMPIYEERGIPMMSPSATNPPLTQQGSRVFNRVVFTDAAQGKFAAEYMYNTLGVRDIAIMHDGQAYGQGLAEVVRDEFTALGGNVVAFQAITPGEADYSAPLADIAAQNPEVLYYGGYGAEGVVIVNQMDTAGLEETLFFGDDGTFGEDFLVRTGENGEGAYSTSLIPPATPEREEFDQKYEDQFGVAAGVLSPYTWTAYDAAAVLIAAIKEVAILGDDGNLYVPRGTLMETVRGTSGYTGLSGSISCDETGECSGSGPTFYLIQGGEWVEAQ